MLTHSVIIIDIPFVAYKQKEEKIFHYGPQMSERKDYYWGKMHVNANKCPTTTCLKNASYANKRPTMTIELQGCMLCK